MRRVRAFVSCVLAIAGTTVPAAAAAPPRTTLEGTLRVTATTGPHGQTKVVSSLHSPDGTLTLRPPAVPNVTPRQRRAIRRSLRAAAGERVRLTGHRAQAPQTFVVERVEILPPLPTDPGEPSPLPARPRRLAVVLVRWAGQGAAGLPDAASTRAWAFDGATSLAAFYRTVSSNVIQIRGDVLGATFPNSANASASCAPLDTAVSRATTAMPQLQAYDHVVLVTQYTGPQLCAEIGRAHVDGRWAVVNGAFAQRQERFLMATAHEVGHMFGLLHAGYGRCAQVPPVESCVADTAYGDPWDAMGNALPTPQLSAVHKAFLGVLPPSAVLTVTRSGQYTMRASDAPGYDGVRLLQVPVGTTGLVYGLEVRGPRAAFGPYLPGDNVANGVSIRLFAADRGPVLEDDDTVLVETTPHDGYAPRTSALPAGRSWSDPANGIRVDVLQAGGGWATVRITRP